MTTPLPGEAWTSDEVDDMTALVRSHPDEGGTLDSLSNVAVASPSDGDTLVYDADSGLWVPGAGGSESATTPGVGDRVLIQKLSLALNVDGGIHAIDMTGATVVYQEGDSLAFEEADSQGIGPSWSIRPQVDGVYAAWAIVNISDSVPLTDGMRLRARLVGENWFGAGWSHDHEHGDYVIQVKTVITDWWTALVDWGSPPFLDDLNLQYQIDGQVGALTANSVAYIGAVRLA